MKTYNAQISGVHKEEEKLLVELLEQQRMLVNEASSVAFNEKLFRLPDLHGRFYHSAREKYPHIPSQVVIKAEQEVVAMFKSMRSNKKLPTKPFVKKNLSLRLDKRIFSRTKSPTRINIITTEKRKEFDILVYPKLQELMDQHQWSDPLVFFKDGKLMLSMTFDVSVPLVEPTLCLGVDLGIRRAAACSDGRIIIDRKFNKEKRRLRYLKRVLQSKGTKSSRKHLKKLKRKERNKNKNQTHLISNIILQTNANVIALENLQGIKAKKYKRQNKNAISQVPLFDLRRILTYKAEHRGMTVCLVSPAWTSQTDSQSGKREGERKGCRFFSASGKVFDADINAAINIALRSKHPVSQGNLLDGQGIVNCPNACQSSGRKTQECCKPTVLSVGG